MPSALAGRGRNRLSLCKVIQWRLDHTVTRLAAARLAALLGLALLAASLGGCTKCGWLWNDQGPGTCHSDAPR